MSNQFVFNDRLPIGPLKIAALNSCKDLAKDVNDIIVSFRKNDMEALKNQPENLHYRGYEEENYLLKLQTPRFGSGEAKGQIDESVRGADVFVMADVTNYSLTYTLNGFENHMSPDDHYQDLKRIIAACIPSAHRVNVIMPFLYESRQHKRTKRESLDCASALIELVDMGVSNIITFDAHDPRVQNSIPLHGFDHFSPTYQFVKTIFENIPDLVIDKDHLMIISPDEGAMNRAVYLANNLKVDMGMFYKRRDYSRIVDGRNPIVAHEFLGAPVEGKDVWIVDDMIASGESMIDVASELKRRGANRIFVIATFGLFTKGMARFDKAIADGIIYKVVTTNLVYQSEELLSRDYYISCGMSKYIAYIIDTLNHDNSIARLLDPYDRIQRLVSKYKEEHKEA